MKINEVVNIPVPKRDVSTKQFQIQLSLKTGFPFIEQLFRNY